jgi:hypothetical protein
MRFYTGLPGLTFLNPDDYSSFGNRSTALAFLQRFTHEPDRIAEMREIISAAGIKPEGLADRQVIAHLANLLVSGTVLVPRVFQGGPVGITMEEAPAAASAKAPPKPLPKLHWVEFKVVDDETGRPIEGIELTIKLPDGRTEVRTTNAGGLIEINDTLMGECQVRSQLKSPRFSETYDFVSLT